MSNNDGMFIYVSLIERPESLDPVRAIRVNDNCFELLESSPDPEHHYWGYVKGNVVRCREVQFAPGERGYVAEKFPEGLCH